MEEKEKNGHGHGGADHSHHHHHHSHHHHSKRKKKKTKFAKFLAENKRALIGVGISLVVFAVLIVCVVLFQNSGEKISGEVAATQPTQAQPQTQVQISSGTVGLALPHITQDVPLVDSWVEACVSDDALTPATQILEGYRKDGSRLDIGLGVELRYEVTSLPQDLFVASAKIQVSADPSFSSSRSFDLGPEERSVKVYLLKADTEYHYRVSVTLSDRSVTSIQSSFHTADLPRILSIDGIVNVRDIGGWETTDGKTIRQGRLYRGSELDDAKGNGYELTQTGLQDMLTVLGIRMDMDLRTPAVVDGHRALGENVAQKVYSAPQYEGIFTDAGKDAMKEVFTDLSNLDNYPVYLHCTHGMDRTGTVCYLLEAVLGVSEEDLIREYELSALYYTVTDRTLLEPMIQGLKEYGGETLQQNAENYLLSIGITADQIAALRSIYLV